MILKSLEIQLSFCFSSPWFYLQWTNFLSFYPPQCNILKDYVWNGRSSGVHLEIFYRGFWLCWGVGKSLDDEYDFYMKDPSSIWGGRHFNRRSNLSMTNPSSQWGVIPLNGSMINRVKQSVPLLITPMD